MLVDIPNIPFMEHVGNGELKHARLRRDFTAHGIFGKFAKVNVDITIDNHNFHGKLIVPLAIFISYVELPEGTGTHDQTSSDIFGDNRP